MHSPRTLAHATIERIPPAAPGSSPSATKFTGGQAVVALVVLVLAAFLPYPAKTVAPVRISACYPVPLKMTLAEPRFLLSAAGISAVSAALVATRRRCPGDGR